MANWPGFVVWLAATGGQENEGAYALHGADWDVATEKMWTDNHDLPQSGGLWVWEGVIIEDDEDLDNWKPGEGFWRPPTHAECAALLCAQDERPWHGNDDDRRETWDELMESYGIHKREMWILEGAL